MDKCPKAKTAKKSVKKTRKITQPAVVIEINKSGGFPAKYTPQESSAPIDIPTPPKKKMNPKPRRPKIVDDGTRFDLF